MSPAITHLSCKWSKEDDEQLVGLLAEGYSQVEIAERLGRTWHGVRNRIYRLRRRGIDLPASPTIYPEKDARYVMRGFVLSGSADGKKLEIDCGKQGLVRIQARDDLFRFSSKHVRVVLVEEARTNG